MTLDVYHGRKKKKKKKTTVEAYLGNGNHYRSSFHWNCRCNPIRHDLRRGCHKPLSFLLHRHQYRRIPCTCSRHSNYPKRHQLQDKLYKIQSAFDISNTDISKCPLLSKNIIWKLFLLMLTFQLLFISNNQYLKVNFLEPENLL